MSRFVMQTALGDKIAYGFDRIVGYYYQAYSQEGECEWSEESGAL